ncbi:citrinin biosynthesis transcriptional activator [Fusarium austroafricanum]|uniref:Citrinin biosynthesis transcriptional activator n=1 Tax=Fusarium austroafricanum TaxID=2364996 RepID=A0A8H4KRY4_9HYPO|nr:citrinin biosynthesis transcriptional activator [Fusarium austroafricanum]
MATGIRQQPGLACEECRRRKARCDRTRPQCATCAEAGTACVVIDKRPPRGPKKGQIKALKNRVASLEWQLYGQSGPIAYETADLVSDATQAQIATPESLINIPLHEMDDGFLATDTSWAFLNGGPALEDLPELPSLAPISLSPYSDLNSSNHASNNIFTTPMSSTASSSRLYTPPTPTIVKELNMSERVRANFTLSKALYTQTRQMLNELDTLDSDTVQIEHIQAGLLVAHYEYLRVYEHQAMLTTGRTFRLIQMSRLYDIDGTLGSPSLSSMTPAVSFSETEEKRRTFWLAFAFDRFLSTRNEWPLTLHEETICTRLPAPETNFQNNQPIQMEFLSEIMSNGSSNSLSPFAECIVLSALYGRCMNHRRLVQAAIASGNVSTDIWKRLEWLSCALDNRSQRYFQPTTAGLSLVERDSMLAFSHMLAHSSVIYLYDTTKSIPFLLGNSPWQPLTVSLEQKAYHSARYIAGLAAAVPRLEYFKVHPFAPNALSSASTFLMSHANTSGISPSFEDGSVELEQLLNAVRSLKEFNLLAQDVLRMLESGR